MTPDAFQAFAGVSRETLQDFTAYHALIVKWQAKMNLVSPTTLDPGWTEIADLGSGGGFPGLVLAILARGAGRATRFHLVESDGRKAAFLIEVALSLKLLNHSVFVVAQRAERLGTSPLAGTIDAVTARALAGLPDLLAHAAPLLRPGGRCLFLKGARADAEIAAAQDAGWRFDLARHPSRLDGDGAILAIDALTRAGTGRTAIPQAIDRP